MEDIIKNKFVTEADDNKITVTLPTIDQLRKATENNTDIYEDITSEFHVALNHKLAEISSKGRYGKIRTAASQYEMKHFNDKDLSTERLLGMYAGFMAGAEWADEHPDEEKIDKVGESLANILAAMINNGPGEINVSQFIKDQWNR